MELGNLSFQFLFGRYSFLICCLKFLDPLSYLSATFTLYTILENFSEMYSKYFYLHLPSSLLIRFGVRCISTKLSIPL